MKYFKIVFLLLIIFPKYSFSKTEIIDKTIAVVNNNTILNSDIYITYNFMKLNNQKYTKKKLIYGSMLYKKILNKLIIDNLILELAIQKGIYICKKEINYYINNFLLKNNFNKKILKTYLLSLNIKNNDFIKKIKKEIILHKIKNIEIFNRINIFPEEINSLTNKILNKEKTKEYNISYILIPFKENYNSFIKNKLRTLSNILTIKSKKNIDFKELVKKFSSKKTKIILENIGWINCNNLPKIFIPYLKNAKKNKIIGPIYSNAGFFILKINDIYDNRKKLVTKINSYHIYFHPLTNFFYKNKDFKFVEIIKKIKNSDLEYNYLYKKQKLFKYLNFNKNFNKFNYKYILSEELLNKIINLKKGNISNIFYLNNRWNCIKILNIENIYDKSKINKLSFNKIFNFKFKKELKKLEYDLKSSSYIIITEKFL